MDLNLMRDGNRSLLMVVNGAEEIQQQRSTQAVATHRHWRRSELRMQWQEQQEQHRNPGPGLSIPF
jgi:hypothetical protein